MRVYKHCCDVVQEGRRDVLTFVLGVRRQTGRPVAHQARLQQHDETARRQRQTFQPSQQLSQTSRKVVARQMTEDDSRSSCLRRVLLGLCVL